jgi:hypothetical protein
MAQSGRPKTSARLSDFWQQADRHARVASTASVVNDPDVWSGRALQEFFVDVADAVLHQCIRPLIGAFHAPGHHGYHNKDACPGAITR